MEVVQFIGKHLHQEHLLLATASYNEKRRQVNEAVKSAQDPGKRVAEMIQIDLAAVKRTPYLQIGKAFFTSIDIGRYLPLLRVAARHVALHNLALSAIARHVASRHWALPAFATWRAAPCSRFCPNTTLDMTRRVSELLERKLLICIIIKFLHF